MEKLFINILQMSISASYLILVVLLVRFLLQKAPKSMRSFLWLLVGIRLLVPFSVESEFSLIPDTNAVDQYIYEMQQPDKNEIQNDILYIEKSDTKIPVSQPVQDTYIPSAEKNISKTQAAVLICTKIWLLGMTLMTGYMLISWLRLKNRVKISVPVDIALDNSHVKVYQSDMVESPFLFGLIKPRIYIPNHITADELPYVVQHEMTHLKRKDYLIKPAGFLLLSVYWFNPCIWIAYIMLCKDIELICDEKVIKKLGASCKKAYSQALLNSAVTRRVIAACPIAFGEVSVKERVKNVLNYKKPAFWVITMAVLACIIVPVCFMTQKKPALLEHEESVNAAEIAGEYLLTVPQQDEYLFIPRLSLDTDGKFSFGYSAISSYLPYGNFELENNILTAVTDDGKYHYQFTLDKDGSLVFDAEHSSDLIPTEAADAPVIDGSVFVKNSTFYTNYYTEDMEDLLTRIESLQKENLQKMYQGTTITVQELEKNLVKIEELQKQLAAEEAVLKHQLEELETLQPNQEETVLQQEKLKQEKLQELLQQAQSSALQLEEAHAEIKSLQESAKANQTAYDTIEQWAQAFCDRDGATIIQLADERVEQKLVNDDILLHGFDGEKDYVSFGWSSPWPWGGNYDENVSADNYRIINVTDRSAEILYYAWVSDPHVTVWRELLTYRVENDKCVITSETLEFKDYICTSEEFYQAYPGGIITGTMMDYYSFNEAGETLNNHAKKNSDDKWYSKMLKPDSSAICLLNILDNPNKVGTHVTYSDTDPDSCTVTLEFYEDGNSVDIQMIQPYGSDGVWLPYSGHSGDPASQDTTAESGSYIITDQNIDDVIAADAKTLEALFPNHHEFTPLGGFSKSVDLNGDGIEEKIELTDLGYNGGDGGYALKVTAKTGELIPLPDGYTEEGGFPLGTSYINSDGEEQPALRIWLGDEKRNVTIATIMSDPLIRIYERKWQFDEMKDGYLKKDSFDARVDVISGCNIMNYNNDKTPTLVLKSYVSGCLGHIDSLGYVITELRLREDNTWDSRYYFLLDSCGDKMLAARNYESAGNGGPSILPFEKDTDINFLQLTPDE